MRWVGALTQPRRGWGTGGCSPARPRGTGLFVEGQLPEGSRRCAQLAISALGRVGEPEGGSASPSTSHLPRRGAKVRRGRAALSQKVCTALCGSRGGGTPPRHPRGANASQTTANKLSRCSRSEESLAGSSRDQRGAQGLMPPPVPHPGELSPPAQRPAALWGRRGWRKRPETLTFGWHWVSPAPQRLVAVPQPCQSCQRLAHPAGSAFRDALVCQSSPAVHGDKPGVSPRPSAARSEPRERREATPGCGEL